MTRTHGDSRTRRRVVAAAVLVALAALGAGEPRAGANKPAAPSVVRLRVTHRVHAQFQDTLTVAMHQRATVGDSDYDIEVTEFYPQFAIIDSTKQVVSLSDEPKNPAFRIAIFQEGKETETTWAFYGVDIPHFARTSYLAFQVLGFEYRGKVIGDVGKKAKKPKGAKP